MVGAVRFELTTSWTRTKRASQTTLRPDTNSSLPASDMKGNVEFWTWKSKTSFANAIIRAG